MFAVWVFVKKTLQGDLLTTGHHQDKVISLAGNTDNIARTRAQFDEMWGGQHLIR
ncbi:hypothetical protein NUK37_06235 [Alcaligenes faecalis]|nr:hypothetical protein [Alcaligenes faecalis]MCR4143891.1 hypothetical protein [Alcaligenes faecalis]